jgi:hypothetical protein
MRRHANDLVHIISPAFQVMGAAFFVLKHSKPLRLLGSSMGSLAIVPNRVFDLLESELGTNIALRNLTKVNQVYVFSFFSLSHRR